MAKLERVSAWLGQTIESCNIGGQTLVAFLYIVAFLYTRPFLVVSCSVSGTRKTSQINIITRSVGSRLQ